MGIPYLTATLEPYAVHRLLQDEPVVIDGPALAYHMLNMCRVNGISQPSYCLVGQSTVAWLGALASCQVVVQAMYFEGHLPASKLEVRMERLVKSTAQLSRLFSDNPHGCPTSQLALDGREIAVDVFKAGIPRSRPFVDPASWCPPSSTLSDDIPGTRTWHCSCLARQTPTALDMCWNWAALL